MERFDAGASALVDTEMEPGLRWRLRADDSQLCASQGLYEVRGSGPTAVEVGEQVGRLLIVDVPRRGDDTLRASEQKGLRQAERLDRRIGRRLAGLAPCQDDPRWRPLQRQDVSDAELLAIGEEQRAVPTPEPCHLRVP